jgi:hypothetical protein
MTNYVTQVFLEKDADGKSIWRDYYSGINKTKAIDVYLDVTEMYPRKIVRVLENDKIILKRNVNVEENNE